MVHSATMQAVIYPTLRQLNFYIDIYPLKAEADMENLLTINCSSSATRMDVPFAVHTL